MVLLVSIEYLQKASVGFLHFQGASLIHSGCFLITPM